jgi:hypothetical protein
MDNQINKVGETGLNSSLSDPFKKNSIRSITVVYRENVFSEKWYAYGIVEFSNGNTSGKQKFEADTFDEVSLLIKQFINHEL